MKVPMLDPSLGNAEFMEELLETSERVIRSGQYILGEEVEAFEQEVADYIDVKYAIGVSSGSDALLASLMALDIGPGDEVLCPSFTFFATAGSIARTGATPIFVDIHPRTFNMDLRDKDITRNTKAIMPVHLFGQCANMDYIKDIAERYNLPIIEDACQSIGATFGLKHAGTLGDMGCFSFFPSKNLGGFGDAGLVTTNNAELASKIKMLRNHGARERYYHDFIGGNFRIDALQAALLRVKLRYLSKMKARRIENAQIYLDLQVKRFTPECHKYAEHVYNQFTIRLPNEATRNNVIELLQKKGISSAIYYPLPLHKQKCFKSTVYLPYTDKAASQVLSLPIASEITTEQISYVANCLNGYKIS